MIGDAMMMDERTVRAVMEKHRARLMEVPGVQGVALGTAAPDQGEGLAILVFHSANARLEEIPHELEGVPVVVQETGEFRAMAAAGPPR